MYQHNQVSSFVSQVNEFDIKEILKEDLTTYKTEIDLPQQYYFVNFKDKLVAHWVEDQGFVLSTPLRFEKRYRKFKKLSIKGFIKEFE